MAGGDVPEVRREEEGVKGGAVVGGCTWGLFRFNEKITKIINNQIKIYMYI